MQRKAVKVKKKETCPVPAVDIFSLGHFMFGMTTGAIFFIMNFFFIRLNCSIIYPLLLNWFLAFSVFFIWEAIEHIVLSKEVYIKRQGQVNWCESKVNVITDLLVEFAAFNLIFLPSIALVTDIIFAFGISLFPFIIDPIVAIYIHRRKGLF